MASTKTPEQIWSEYDKMRSYNDALNLIETVEKNQMFYLGEQWDGVNAPNIEKPVVNIIRQSIDYYVSNTVSDDISVQIEIPEDLSPDTKEAINYIVSTEIDKILEMIKFKSKQRKFIRDCALDGDAYNYFWFDTSKNKKAKYIGAINMELIDNTNIGFGDPTEMDAQKQPYILIVQKLPTDIVKEMAEEAGKNPDDVKADAESYDQNEMNANMQGEYTTLITRLWRYKGTIHACKATKNAIIKDEIDLMQVLYPISNMVWREKKNCYHGESPVTAVIPNQIMINKYYMMTNEFLKKTAFPKTIYDKQKLPNGINNKVEAIGVQGNPNEAIITSSPIQPMNAQATQYVQDLIDKTKESLGIYDVALGNARPENTSAIIALQKTASQPLELQKMDYYQMIEDSVRIILDIMSAYYGVRSITIKHTLTPEELMKIKQAQQMQMPADPMNPAPAVPQGDEDGEIEMDIDFDYAELSPENIQLTVEVGASAYWSEIMQMQTMDNMYRAQIIPDPQTYVEEMPNGIIRKKNIIEAIKRKEVKDQQLAMQASAMQTPTQVL